MENLWKEALGFDIINHALILTPHTIIASKSRDHHK